jgi:hypothetical protein
LGEHPEYSKSKVMYSALDSLVKEIAVAPENAELSGEEILAKAHEQVQEALGVFGVVKQQQEQSPQQKPLAKKKPVVPPTLGKIPAAEGNDTSGGKFAVLDRMADTDPIRFESELGKLSESERERYLAQA